MLFSQQTPEVQKFSAQYVDGVVNLEWIMRSGSVCEGIGILRSDDSTNFQLIGYIKGMCGSLTSPVTYRHQDNLPLKGKLAYYQLVLGTVAKSPIISTFVTDINKLDYHIYPNPVLTTSILEFENLKNEDHELKIYDNKGVLIHTEHTIDNHYLIQTQGLGQGLYYFTILKDGTESNFTKGSFYKFDSN
jgi:hypothetical protein